MRTTMIQTSTNDSLSNNITEITKLKNFLVLLWPFFNPLLFFYLSFEVQTKYFAVQMGTEYKLH